MVIKMLTELLPLLQAVKRIKTSPLSAEEIERIREGLKVFKLDWTSVWKYVVPYRDPSLLRRQWRIALGTQRSYKVDDAKREKRRIYELNRRKRKIADSANWQPLSEKEDNLVDGNTGENHSEDDYADDVNEASVHQGFLADWRPGASSLILNEHPCFDIRAKGPPMNPISANSQLEEQPKEYGSGKAQSPSDGIHVFPHASLYQHPHTTSLPTHVRHLAPNNMQLNHQVLHSSSNTPKSQIYLLPYRTRRTGRARLVKLAPELPPVNLPPSVRVIPQSDFKNNQSGVSMKIPATRGSGDAGRESIVPEVCHVGNSKVTKSVKINGDRSNQGKENVTNSCSAESAFVQDTGFTEERGPDLETQMHPLLFQASEHGHRPYYPSSCSTGGSHSFSFFSGSQPQLNLSLFQGQQQVAHAVQSVSMSSKAAEFGSASYGIDFHPLLQRTDDENGELLTTFSIPHNAHTGNQFDAAQNKSFSAAPRPSSPTEKANELDLDIHLSSISTNGKGRESRDTGSSTQPRSTVINSEIATVTHKLSSPHHYCNDNSPTVPSNPVPGANASALPSNNLCRSHMDDIGDQSHPEIVMEQEELSDSDEEIEEHVEFECEEMADSDGDASSNCEPISEMQDKEVSSCAAEKVTTNKDFDQRCEPGGPFHSSTSILKRSNPFLKLSLMSPAKDAGSVSWLSLDSCATIGLPSMKANPEGCTINEVPTAQSLASCSPNKDNKKTVASPELVANQKDDVGMSQQLSLGPLAVSAVRKPRKRA
uniref:Uncharacterized protein MANES_17G038900 n=1 Tax=Rhizophora mucronata TaxID=61149 RepID=A0A2P2KD83_RHIMU